MGSKTFAIDLPCGVFYDLSNLVLDLNGTLTEDGNFIDGVVDRLKTVSKVLNVYILTADTCRTMEGLTDELQKGCCVNVHCLEHGRGDLQKLAFLEELGREQTVAIGNGCNDALMLKEAALGICILGREGASTDALSSSDVVFRHICDALDIFLKPNRMIATLRK
ncbi:MAG TPA: ATPase P [Thermodesulfobacteriaceae bacterium]|nr:ATPase P [Thermodesulfobacteriaceae bacterium]